MPEFWIALWKAHILKCGTPNEFDYHMLFVDGIRHSFSHHEPIHHELDEIQNPCMHFVTSEEYSGWETTSPEMLEALCRRFYTEEEIKVELFRYELWE